MMEEVRKKRRQNEVASLNLVGKPALTLQEKFNFDETHVDLNALLTCAGINNIRVGACCMVTSCF